MHSWRRGANRPARPSGCARHRAQHRRLHHPGAHIHGQQLALQLVAGLGEARHRPCVAHAVALLRRLALPLVQLLGRGSGGEWVGGWAYMCVLCLRECPPASRCICCACRLLWRIAQSWQHAHYTCLPTTLLPTLFRKASSCSSAAAYSRRLASSWRAAAAAASAALCWSRRGASAAAAAGSAPANFSSATSRSAGTAGGGGGGRGDLSRDGTEAQRRVEARHGCVQLQLRRGSGRRAVLTERLWGLETMLSSRSDAWAKWEQLAVLQARWREERLG